MSNKNSHYKKPVAEVKKPIAEVKEKETTYKIKQEKDLGFKKRNYFIAGEKMLIEAGKEYTQADYSKFSNEAKNIFFE